VKIMEYLLSGMSVIENALAESALGFTEFGEHEALTATGVSTALALIFLLASLYKGLNSL